MFSLCSIQLSCNFCFCGFCSEDDESSPQITAKTVGIISDIPGGNPQSLVNRVEKIDEDLVVSQKAAKFLFPIVDTPQKSEARVAVFFKFVIDHVLNYIQPIVRQIKTSSDLKKFKFKPECIFQTSIEKNFNKLEIWEYKQIEKKYFSEVSNCIFKHVISFLDANFVGGMEYKKVVQSISFSIFYKIVKEDITYLEWDDILLVKCFEWNVSEKYLKMLQLRKDVIQEIEKHILIFFEPYLSGKITEKTEDKERAPIIEGLYRDLQNKFGEVPFKRDVIELHALDKYLFLCGYFVRQGYGIELGKVPSVHSIINIGRIGIILKELCIPIKDGLMIDFPGTKVSFSLKNVEATMLEKLKLIEGQETKQ